MNKTPDPRYTASFEYCGQPKPRWIARFCGEWISHHETRKEAVAATHEHNTIRMSKFSGTAEPSVSGYAQPGATASNGGGSVLTNQP